MLAATVLPDLMSGVIVVELRGVLDTRTAPRLRAVLLKCLARKPDTVVVDVSDLRLGHRTQLTVFPAALRTIGSAAVTMVLCGADASLREHLQGRTLGRVTVQPDRAAALATLTPLRPTGEQSSSHRLDPTPGAPSVARRLTAAACAGWGLDELSGPASLVVSELVSNAVQHAGTSMVLRVALCGEQLHLSVEDGSPTPPRAPGAEGGSEEDQLAERGRGLHLVATYATDWGSIVGDGGKTVWATLQLPSSS